MFILIEFILTYASPAIIFLQFMQRLGRVYFIVDGFVWCGVVVAVLYTVDRILLDGREGGRLGF
jgi:hypothetical protein